MNSHSGTLPRLTVLNRQRRIPMDMPWIRRVAGTALPLCAKSAIPGSAFLSLSAIEATIISDSKIAKIHDAFFQDPAPTDVITFEHGEILLGVSTIANHARAFAMSPSAEAALCVIHGMLHLGGWNDLNPSEARHMARRQEKIFLLATQNQPPSVQSMPRQYRGRADAQTS